MVQTFIHTHDDTFKAVKLESSLFAHRQTNKEGVSLFDIFVFDEAYDILFRQLFFEAQADLMQVIPSRFIKDMPIDEQYFQTADFLNEEDFNLWLDIPRRWLLQYSKYLDILIKEFLVAYILWRWLETKSPQFSQYYFLRLEILKPQIKKMFQRSDHPYELVPRPL
jgi:hypothetical protein